MEYTCESGQTDTDTVKVKVSDGEFYIRFATFIPVNFIPNPPIKLPPSFVCLSGELSPATRAIAHGGDNRGFDSNANSYRSLHLLTVTPEEKCDTSASLNGVREGSEFKDAKRSFAYADDALSDDFRIGPEDQDAELNDCHLLDQTDILRDKTWFAEATRLSEDKIQVRFHGDAGNPIPFFTFDISWDFTITIDTSRERPHWTLQGWYDCFLAYEIYINGISIHQRAPNSFDFTELSTCLGGTSPVMLNDSDDL